MSVPPTNDSHFLESLRIEAALEANPEGLTRKQVEALTDTPSVTKAISMMNRVFGYVVHGEWRHHGLRANGKVTGRYRLYKLVAKPTHKQSELPL
jgi:hypothetical protein